MLNSRWNRALQRLVGTVVFRAKILLGDRLMVQPIEIQLAEPYVRRKPLNRMTCLRLSDSCAVDPNIAETG